jgi:hypothetical protein
LWFAAFRYGGSLHFWNLRMEHGDLHYDLLGFEDPD